MRERFPHGLVVNLMGWDIVVSEFEYQLRYYVCFGSIIGMMVRVFANGPGDLGSIPGRVIPKTQKMVLDASLLNSNIR